MAKKENQARLFGGVVGHTTEYERIVDLTTGKLIKEKPEA